MNFKVKKFLNLPELMFSVEDRTITKGRLKKLKYGGLGLTPPLLS